MRTVRFSVLFGLVAVAAAAEPRVRVGGSLAGCGLEELTRAELRRTGVDPESRWSLELQPLDGKVKLSLSAEGRSLLERSLPGGEDCAGLAMAASLIVERYARELASAPAAPVAETIVAKPRKTERHEKPEVRVTSAAPQRVRRASPPPPPTQSSPTPPPPVERAPETEPDHAFEAAPEPMVEPPLVVAAATTPPVPDVVTQALIERIGTSARTDSTEAVSATIIAEPPRVTAPATEPRTAVDVRLSSWDVGAEGLAFYALGDRARPALALVATGLLNDRWRVGLRAWAGLPETDKVMVLGAERGTLTAQHFAAAARVGPCLRTALKVCGELSLGARFAWARGEGKNVFAQQTGWLVSPLLGPTATASLRPVKWLSLSLALGASFNLLPARFQIDDKLQAAPQTAQLPLAELFATLSVSLAGDR